MHILRLEYAVPDFDAFKESFDNDPIGRERSGVRRYRLLRPTSDPNCVIIDLEFDSASEAEAVHAALRELWDRVDVMHSPKYRSSRRWRSKSTDSMDPSIKQSLSLPLSVA
jgi:hypothetical protein